ncbi:Syntaxin-3 [Coemansia interrupta]|uniref:Syntaxin-3 n=1 Tax=Coemansia interrupta TaxID=1126814 RepID=A0A9W8HN93_9FUNG|nr:Syntaxin-3 [Coemansia interrupta]
MSRNRFSEFIARRRENSFDDSGSPDSLTSVEESDANVDMEKYFTTLNGIERDIEGVNGSVDELGVLHGRLLSTADGDKSEAIARQRDQKTADINDTIKKLRSELNAVEQMNRNTQLAPGDEAIRRSRHAVLARKLMAVLDKYRTLERESQKRYRTRMEKHIRLERDIRDINRTIELLNRMFIDMQEIVAEQQDVLDNIEQAVDNTLDHTTQANEQVKRATWLRIKIRRKKWWLLFLLLILIIAIALSVALPVAM